MNISKTLAVLIFGVFGATAASAQTAAVIGKHYESVGAAGACNNTSSCTVNFKPNPVQSVIMINRVECQITSTAPISYALLQIHTTNDINTAVKFKGIDIANSTQVGQNSYVSIVNAETATFMGIGRFPKVTIYSVGVTQFASCSINGVLVP